MDQESLTRWKVGRWRARTDLEWLCREVLGFEDVSRNLHAGLLDVLQKFPKPTREQFEENDKYIGKKWIYKPVKPLKELLCSKKTLILDFRGSLKSTINLVAHTIQWIINYPDITLLVVQANTDKAKLVLREIKAHFTGNVKFRELFPEHCPQKKIFDWGTQEAFDTEARPPSSTRKESTVMIASIDKGVAGMHFDVIKFSDIVEENNSQDVIQANRIYNNFLLMHDLLVSPMFWIDVEGTRYNFGDAYGKIIDDQKKLPPEQRTWDFYINAVFIRDVDGPRTYGPEEMEAPFKKDADGNYISRWPERHPLKGLLEKQRNNPYIFSCQQLNAPVSSADGRNIFPVDDKYPTWITEEQFQNVRQEYTQIVVDTGETDTKRSDPSAITVGTWDSAGRLYIKQIYHGKFKTDELITLIVKACKLHKPRYLDIEETSYVRGLKASLQRALARAGVYVALRFLKRDNQKSKKERIELTLQPWYKEGWIRFLNTLQAKQEMLQEFDRFPLGAHDDILDTLADFFQNKDFFGRESPRPDDPAAVAARNQAARDLAFATMIGTAPIPDLANDPNHRARNGITTIL